MCLNTGRSGEFTASGVANKLGVRPEHIEVAASGEGQTDGIIEVIEYLGADTFLIVDCGAEEKVTVRLNGDTDLQPGANIGLHFPTDKLHFFSEEGKALRQG